LSTYLLETVKKTETQGVTPPAQSVQPGNKDAPKEDPDVAGARILNTACTTCHDLSAVTGKKEDRASWERIVNGMVGYGAGLKDAEIPALADYLFRHYGPPREAPKAPEPVPSDTPLQPRK
jgi:cytochrome c5